MSNIIGAKLQTIFDICKFYTAFFVFFNYQAGNYLLLGW